MIPFVSDEKQEELVKKLIEAEESRNRGSVLIKEAKKTYENILLGEEKEQE